MARRLSLLILLAALSLAAPVAARQAADIPKPAATSACAMSAFDKETGPAPTLEAAWLVASKSKCLRWLQVFASRNPGRAMPVLITLALRDTLPAADQLTLLSYLTTKAALDSVAESDRPRVRASLNRLYLRALLDAGLGAKVVEAYRALPLADWDAVLQPVLQETDVQVAGLSVRLPEVYDHRFGKYDLAAAYLMTGDAATARGLMPREALSESQTYMRCVAGEVACMGRADDLGPVAYLGHLLYSPRADPYPMAVAFIADRSDERTMGVWADVMCRVFAEPQYAVYCHNIRTYTASSDRGIIERGWTNRVTAAQLILKDLAPAGFDAKRRAMASLLKAEARRQDRATARLDSPEPTADRCAHPDAMGPLLEALFNGPDGRLVDADKWPSSKEGLAPAVAPMEPFRVKAAAADLACLHTKRAVVLYSAAAYEKHRVDQTPPEILALDPMIWNRTRDHGYVLWQADDHGGVLKLKHTDEGWTFESVIVWRSAPFLTDDDEDQ